MPSKRQEMKNQSKRREDNSNMRKKSSDKQRPHDISEKLTKQLPMSMRDWGQVTLYWLALVLLSGAIGCAGCQTKTQKVQQNTRSLQIKDRKTPPRTRPQTLVKKPTTTGVIKKTEKPKTKVTTIAKPVIAKSIHHIQPGKPDENGVRRLFKFADLVQNEHFYEAKVYGKDRPTFVYLRGKKGIYTYWLSPDLKTAKKLPKNCTVMEENGFGVLCLTSSYEATRSKKEKLQFFSEQGKVTWTSPIFINQLSIWRVYFARKTKKMVIVYIPGYGGNKDVYIASEKGVEGKGPLSTWPQICKNPNVYHSPDWIHFNPTREELSYKTANMWLRMSLKDYNILSKRKIKNLHDIQLPSGRNYNTRQVDLTPKEKDKKKKVYLFQMINANGQVLWEKKTTSYKMKFRQFVQNERFVLLYNQKSSHYYLHNTTTGKQVMEKPISFVGKNAGGIFLSTINGTISTVQLRQGKWQQIDYKIGYTSIQKAWSDTKNIYFSNTTYEVNSRYIYTEPISPLSRKARNNNNAVFSISK